ncbi:MAG: hypothetical protein HFI66_01770 [Lachnospiraceae bacterium]|jgi:hypothetical protein|nr:hypothetical protein [Lachnospiraceae bacterium]
MKNSSDSLTGKPKNNIPGNHFEEPAEAIRQFSDYKENDRPVPDNNPFWENGHNPLSSKGN